MTTTGVRQWAVVFLVALAAGCSTDVECPQGFERQGELCLPEPAPVAELSGTVRLDDAGAVAGTLVFLERTSHVTFTDDQGRFVLPGVAPGSHTLAAQRIGYVDVRRAVEVDGAGPVELGEVVLAPVPASTGALAGYVTLEGRPDASAGIQVLLDGTGHSAFTADDGRWRLDDVAPGTYRVRALMAGWTPGTAESQTVVAGGTTAVPEFTLQPAERGVGDLTGTVQLFGLEDHTGTQVLLEDAAGLVAHQLTGADGTYAFPDLPGAHYRVTFAHPPWTGRTVDAMVAGDGTWTLPPVTLYVGRHVDERPVVSGLFVDERWALLGVGDPLDARTAVYDRAAGAMLTVPDGTQVVDHDPEADELLVAVRYGYNDVDLYAVRPRSQEKQILASAMTWLGGTPFFADAQNRLFFAQAGRPLRPVDAPPCPTSRATVYPLGDDTDWYELRWATYSGDCPRRLSRLFHLPSGWLSGLASWVAPGEGFALMLEVDPADRLAPGSLKRLALETRYLMPLAYPVTTAVESGALYGLIVTPAEGPPSLVRVDAATGQVRDTLPDVSDARRVDTRMWLTRGGTGELWFLDDDAEVPVHACPGPVERTWHQDARVICQVGTQAPWQLVTYQFGEAPDGTITTEADEVITPYYDAQAVLFLTADGTLKGVHLPTSLSPSAVCTGEEFKANVSPSHRHVAAWCGTGGTGRAWLHDLATGTGTELMDGPGTLSYASFGCTVEEGGRGAVCAYRLAEVGETPWDCGEATCVTAVHLPTGRRATWVGGTGSVMWSADGLGVLVRTYQDSRHLHFGGEAATALTGDWGYPRGIGPSGRYALWQGGGLVRLTDVESGVTTVATVGSAYPLADGRTHLTDEAAVDLETGVVTPFGFTQRLTLGATREAAVGLADGALWQFTPATGLERLGSAVPVSGLPSSTAAWLLEPEFDVGTLVVRDPELGTVVPVVSGAMREVTALDAQSGGRYLVRHDLTAKDVSLCVLELAGRTCASLATGVDPASRLWVAAEADPPRVAFNAWRGGLRLTAVSVGAPGEVDLGPPASNAVFSRDGGHMSFASDGTWWLSGGLQGAPVPIDTAQLFDPAIPLTPDGRGAVYGVHVAAWYQPWRVGSWAVDVP